MPLQATSGAASYDGFGGGAAAVPQYIEDVFSTYLYTGNGTGLTITNNIDLSTKGGMVWLKPRGGAGRHMLWDTTRGARKYVVSNLTDAEVTTDPSYGLYQWNNNGFTLGGNWIGENTSNIATASWTFRKQPKFFDVVTYTGDGSQNQVVAHSLGSAPGCVIIKRTDTTSDWWVAHVGVGSGIAFAGGALRLNATNAWSSSGNVLFTTGTSTSITLYQGPGATAANISGGTYVAYLFAHDAGGFGLTGTDNVISCGSYTGNGSTVGPVVTLGYEPQWLMIKNAGGTGNWQMIDNMRGMPVGSADATIQANLNSAESSAEYVSPTATGFQITGGVSEVNTSGSTYIYIAIRRPMKVPTSGTSVFSPISTSAATGTAVSTGFPVDMQIGGKNAVAGAEKNWVTDRLRGVSTTATESGALLQTTQTDAENTISTPTRFWSNTGFSVIANNGGASQSYWNFRRAPSFFDEVCYTGTGVARTLSHNLGVIPELMIVKVRTGSAGESWTVWNKTIATSNAASTLWLNSTSAVNLFSNRFNSTAPTSSVFTVGDDGATNGSTWTYVAYLFATCAGVSKVGSYTGTGTTKQVDCGFTGGARFVMIKRTDSTGSWYVWDSARGIVAGNDPYLLLNSTSAQVTNTDYVDTYSAGFEISSTAPAEINASGGTYIFLAIA